MDLRTQKVSAKKLQYVAVRRTERMINSKHSDSGKRLLDLSLTVVALFLLSPLIASIAFLVRMQVGSPILFRQKRPGLRGRPFSLLKFRTMSDERDAQGNLLPDERRLLPFGRFLRSFSLDELSELFNVLKGEMSLVGPRPLLMEYLDRYTPKQSSRHDVKPGITGWAQINGRQNISFSKRLEYDLWYINNRSFALDLKILILTVFRVLTRQGVRLNQDVWEVDDLGLSVSIGALSKVREGKKL